MMTPEKRETIRYCYWHTTMTPKEIMRRFDVSEQTIKRLREETTFAEHLEIQKFREKQRAESYVVIKVHPKWIEGIKHLFESRGISFDIPEHFELTEYYQSKL